MVLLKSEKFLGCNEKSSVLKITVALLKLLNVLSIIIIKPSPL